MNSHVDSKITEALKKESHLRTDIAGGDESMFLMLGELMRGRNRWMNLLMMTVQVATFLVAVWCAVRFFTVAETTKSQLTYAVAFLMFLNMSAFIKLWFWLVINRNCVLREVKRVELMLAEMAERSG